MPLTYSDQLSAQLSYNGKIALISWEFSSSLTFYAGWHPKCCINASYWNCYNMYSFIQKLGG